MKQSKISDLDKFDLSIISVLISDGRISVTDLSRKIGLSKTPTQMRLKRLIEGGYIKGFKAIVSSEMLDIECVTFVEVRLLDTREKALTEFNGEILKIPEVEECHMVASKFDYLLKVRTQNIKKYREILAERISILPHVASTSSIITMETIKDHAN